MDLGAERVKVNSVLKSLLQCLYSYAKCSCIIMKEISDKFHQELPTI